MKYTRLAAIYGVSANLLMAVVDASMALILERKSMLSTTISDLAAGEFAWVQDLALCLVGLSLVTTALIAWLCGRKSWREAVGAPALAIAGVAIAGLALYDEYGDGDTGGMVIHIELVGVAAFSFTLAQLALARFAGDIAGWLGWLSYATALIWVLGGAGTYLVPDQIQGAAERLAALAMLVWTLAVNVSLLSASDRFEKQLRL